MLHEVRQATGCDITNTVFMLCYIHLYKNLSTTAVNDLGPAGVKNDSGGQCTCFTDFTQQYYHSANEAHRKSKLFNPFH